MKAIFENMLIEFPEINSIEDAMNKFNKNKDYVDCEMVVMTSIVFEIYIFRWQETRKQLIWIKQFSEHSLEGKSTLYVAYTRGKYINERCTWTHS